MKKKMLCLLGLFPVISLWSQKADLLLPSPIVREQIINHKAFTLSYSSAYVLPSWVAYKITKSQVNEGAEVKGKYIPDPQVSTKSANKKDYKDSGYLMAQFANYLDLQNIEGAVDETFYLTNIAPMKLAFYNNIWLKSEALIRLWVANTEEFSVICGPILAESPFPTIGENNVSVPKRYYKVLYDPQNQQGIGFIFVNGSSSGKLKSYSMSIDEIEKETEIDFFPTLADDIETKIEGPVDYTFWDFELEDKIK